MLAVVLLQSIGLLQFRPEQISLSRMYHDILVNASLLFYINHSYIHIMIIIKPVCIDDSQDRSQQTNWVVATTRFI